MNFADSLSRVPRTIFWSAAAVLTGLVVGVAGISSGPINGFIPSSAPAKTRNIEERSEPKTQSPVIEPALPKPTSDESSLEMLVDKPKSEMPEIVKLTDDETKRIVQYYTENTGQEHFDGNFVGDILITRFYIKDSSTNKTGVIVSIEGVILGVTRDYGVDDFLLRPLDEIESIVFAEYVGRSLPLANVDYAEKVPHQVVIYNPLSETTDFSVFGVGFNGQIPDEAPKLYPRPFELIDYIKENHERVASDDDFTVLVYDNENGPQFGTYISNIDLDPDSEAAEGEFLSHMTRSLVTVPLIGDVIVEMAIVDLWDPNNNRKLLEYLSRTEKPFHMRPIYDLDVA
jgi:hypothetical protein